MVAMLAMVGLVIDGGLMLASHRHAQNAADSAAMTAALAKLRGSTIAAAIAKGKSYVTSARYHESLDDAGCDEVKRAYRSLTGETA